ncbi:MBL fold metallo-hydrolase [Halomarina ordinaria]|uniref:MBL fold metallo-hydrolase n=1 Tax=Halomarina ordinaria TaxID=3033939 RepID=A0ABD5U5Z7_9EURY|nr:MBL fold metallo-hydrolase [Halomarina sp. PSRA2]
MTDRRSEALSAVHRVEFAVDWPPGHVASYLVDCEEPTLVDAGMPGPDGEDVLRESLAAVDCDLADVDHLVLTHPHVDHIGQVGAVLDGADPTVYAPAGVRERFDRDTEDLEATVRENATAAGLTGDELERAVSMAVESLERNRTLLPPDAVDVWFEDGDRLEIGGTPVDVVHTPGHQADHCCLRVDLGDPALVSGDMGIEPFRPVAIHAGLDDGVAEAIGAFYGALDTLSTLESEVERVYPGHGPVHADLAGAVARDRSSLDRMLDRTESQVASGMETAVEVAEARAGDRDIAYIIAEVVGALHHLEREGRVAASVVDGVRRYR